MAVLLSGRKKPAAWMTEGSQEFGAVSPVWLRPATIICHPSSLTGLIKVWFLSLS